ncbi:hypothetical protein COLO4_25982 [Corchorus olitorius]|uniref:Uncharacterized protein n=1 Tax=Corchorus olitorius TaxID=93759 RepID=A0A1R3HZB7_9ROSI|nr:hypothetical protein COLO4_25982 [Corchorus olitorius]
MVNNKKILLLFLVVSAFLLSTSLAGGRSMFMNKLAEEVVDAVLDENGGEELGAVHQHERLLTTNTQDFGADYGNGGE